MTDVSLAADRRLISPEPAKVQLGVVWRRSLRTFGQAPITFIALVLLPLIISALQIGLRLSTLKPGLGAAALKVPQTPSLVIVGLVLTLLQYVVQITCQGAAIHVAARLLAGDRFTWGKALGVGLRRFFPLIGVGILVGLSILLGLILLIVPGLILIFVLALAIPACVVERLGPINSMKRSAYLTRSNRWRILAALLVVTLLPMVAAFALAILGGFVLAKLALGILVVALFVVLVPFLGAIGTILITVLFVELRALKDGGTAPKSVAQVFE